MQQICLQIQPDIPSRSNEYNMTVLEASVRKKIWLIGSAFLLIAIAVGGVYFYFAWRPAQAQEVSSVQTAVARLGELVIYASGTGQVIPASEIDLSFSNEGWISELAVKAGDQVEPGQVVAVLRKNQSDLETLVEIASAKLAVTAAAQALDDLYLDANLERTQTFLALEQARQEVEDLQSSTQPLARAYQSYVEAQQAVGEAQLAYNRTHLTASQANIDQSYVEMRLAQEQLAKAKERFADYADKPETNLTRARLQADLSAAQQNYDNKVANYNAMTGTSSSLEQEAASAKLASAQAALDDAQRHYERLLVGAMQPEIETAQATLARAEATYERIKDGPDPVEIQLLEAQLADAEANLAELQDAPGMVNLTAPVGGTVMEVSVTPGTLVKSGEAVMVLADLSRPLLEVYLDESDLDKVAAGYEAEVVFDAYPDAVFNGRVIEVNPGLSTIANVTTVRALVELESNSSPTVQQIPIGLGASVDVIAGRSQNTVLVPVEALREISPGEYAVFVMQNGEPRLRSVTVGLVDFTSAEITSGLEAGEVVTTGLVEVQ